MAETFHAVFERALAGDDVALQPWWSDPGQALKGLSIYRNTTTKGIIDALIAQFPTVTAVVGEAWMKGAALAFQGAHPPAIPPLVMYGDAFPAWVSGPAIEQDMPFLSGLARLDRLWTECHTAADDNCLGADVLIGLQPEDFLRFGLAPRAAAQWMAFDLTIPSLWRALRLDPALSDFNLEVRPEGLLLTRPDLEVEFRVISFGACAFLTACREGHSIAAAAEAAMAAEPGLALQSTFAALIAAGVFAALVEIHP